MAERESTLRLFRGHPLRFSDACGLRLEPNWSPIFDCTDLDGCYLACGTNGICFTLAPFAGRAMHAIINASENGMSEYAVHIQIKTSHLDELIDRARFSRRSEEHTSELQSL